MKKRFKSLAALSMLLLALLVAACGDNTATSSLAPTNSAATITAADSPATMGDAPLKVQPPVKVAIGFTAPDFTVKDINGQSLKMSQFRGKAVLLNFWSVF